MIAQLNVIIFLAVLVFLAAMILARLYWLDHKDDDS